MTTKARFPSPAVLSKRMIKTFTRLLYAKPMKKLGWKPRMTEILGRLKDYLTISDFVISPVVALIKWPFDVLINPEEVDRVFSVPLTFLGDPKNIETRQYTFKDKTSTRVFYFADFDGEMVWGITARITVRLLKVLGFLENV